MGQCVKGLLDAMRRKCCTPSPRSAPLDRRSGLVRFAFWGLVTLMIGIGLAQAASYVYDANGRLRAITNSTGASAVYVYDVMGNLLHIDSVPADQLKILHSCLRMVP